MANIDKFGQVGDFTVMSSTINLSLTDELRAFVDSNCGDRGLYATPSEFMRELIREKKERIEAQQLRDGVLEGFRDIAKGRTVEFQGDLRSLLAPQAEV
ncbi:MAG: ribbon-helix-helix domain-containing protein [Puniceicoccales bacterium]